MKKNYIQPKSKCVYLNLESMIAESITIKAGIGDGSHDAASKMRDFYDECDENTEFGEW